MGISHLKEHGPEYFKNSFDSAVDQHLLSFNIYLRLMIQNEQLIIVIDDNGAAFPDSFIKSFPSYIENTSHLAPILHKKILLKKRLLYH